MVEAESNVLQYEKKGKIVIITLNRPEKLNTITGELMQELEEAWARFRDDNDAWVAILTGAGTRAFCAGFDLKDYYGRKQKEDGSSTKPPVFHPTEIWKPIIAAINGYALGAGFALAHDCDIRIAAETAQLQIPETMWSIPGGWVSDLTRQMNLGHALELVLWGDSRISAQRGYEMGWINRVVPQDKLMEEAMSWAERILHCAPRAVGNMKQILYQGYYMEPRQGLCFAEEVNANLKQLEDTLEGVKAFIEGRKPEYRNR
jgi:enoyl-CoA hydratase/carnithine racemase